MSNTLFRTERVEPDEQPPAGLPARWDEVDPRLVTFEADAGSTNIRMRYDGVPVNAWHLYTPTFVTNFPKLNVAVEAGVTPEAAKRLTVDMDLSLKNAGDIQHRFRAWMDALDDRLLDFIHSNQRLVGKAGQPASYLRNMQKRQFRERVSSKTGRQYPDSMVVRAKVFAGFGRNSVAPPMRNNLPVIVASRPGESFYTNTGDESGDIVMYGDVVAACLRFDGAYCSPGQYFGMAFTLLSVKTYGQPTVADAETCRMRCTAFPDAMMEELPMN